MSNEIKQGDKVRVSKEEARKYQKARRYVLENSTFKVKSIENDTAFITNGRDDIVISTKYLIKIGTEPTAPKIKVGDRVRKDCLMGIVKEVTPDNVIVDIVDSDGKSLNTGLFDVWMIDSVESVEPTEQTEAEKSNHTISIPVEVDLTDSYWDAYAADLAKEVALKVANKYNDPEQAAEYAVSVAKAVVEGLKRE